MHCRSPAQAYYQTPEHIIAAGVALSIVDALIVGLRFWTRSKQHTALRVDDWLMVPATALTIAMSGLAIYGVSEKSIAHRVQLPPDFEGDPLLVKTEQLSLTSRIEYGFTTILPVALGFIKLSFLFFYHRIFAVERKSGISYMLMGMMALISLWTAVFFFEKVFECGTKFSAIWGTTTEMIENCVDTMQVVLWFCITDFATDVLIILIPIPLIWRLKTTLAKKCATLSVFLVGVVSVAASLCRLIFAAMAVSRGFDPNGDEILTVTLYLYWGIVECGVGIVAACLPSVSFLFRPVSFDHILSKTRSIFSSHESSNASSNGSYNDKTAALHTTDSSSSEGVSPPATPVGLGLCNSTWRATPDFDLGRESDGPILDDVESAVSRGSNRLNGDPSIIDSYTTDSTWKTRGDSLPYQDSLAPPPLAHHMKDFHSNPI